MRPPHLALARAAGALVTACAQPAPAPSSAVRPDLITRVPLGTRVLLCRDGVALPHDVRECVLPVDVTRVHTCRTMFIKRVKARGITNLQLVEGYGQDGRAKHRLLKSLGREDQLDPAMIDRLRASLKRYASKDTSEAAALDLDAITVSPGRRVGSLLPPQSVWRELELGEILSNLARGRRFRFDAANVIKAVVFLRVLDPGSERSLVPSFLPSVFAPDFDGIELQHAYRALQFLAEVGPGLEARLTRAMTEKLFADASLVLFDTTSTYFEGAGPEELASFRSSRDKRGDRPQANLALLTSRVGLPLGHWLHPGRQSDVKSMAEASREFRDRLSLGSFVIVTDHGMVSAANLEALRSEGIEYVITERLRRSTANEALARAGHYQRLNRNLDVKEIKTDGVDPRRPTAVPRPYRTLAAMGRSSTPELGARVWGMRCSGAMDGRDAVHDTWRLRGLDARPEDAREAIDDDPPEANPDDDEHAPPENGW